MDPPEQPPSDAPENPYAPKSKNIGSFFKKLDKSNPADRAEIETTKAREAAERKVENEARQKRKDQRMLHEEEQALKKEAERKKRQREEHKEEIRKAKNREAERNSQAAQLMPPPEAAPPGDHSQHAPPDTSQAGPSKPLGRRPGSKNRSSLDKDARKKPEPTPRIKKVCFDSVRLK